MSFHLLPSRGLDRSRKIFAQWAHGFCTGVILKPQLSDLEPDLSREVSLPLAIRHPAPDAGADVVSEGVFQAIQADGTVLTYQFGRVDLCLMLAVFASVHMEDVV
jgi:hypothetical protein